jgi:hypothetical protein
MLEIKFHALTEPEEKLVFHIAISKFLDSRQEGKRFCTEW